MPTPKTCEHASPAMIAAGIFTCGVCEPAEGPSAPGARRDETARQRVALANAYAGLETALLTLAEESTKAARACRRKRPAPDMDRVRAAIRDVDLAEGDVDTAAYDLQTAGGADG